MAAAEKQPVTGAGAFNGVLTWVDERYPLVSTWKAHLAEYYAPKNFNTWYYFGSLALLVLASQVVTGIWLTMNYKADATLAFASVEYIMREVSWGWLVRYMHSTGASALFICVYLHMFRGMLYGSHRKPRELLWIIGMLIFLLMMAESFLGYLLPWGQMSYWGAKVIINLFDAIPFVGPDLALLIRGDYMVSDTTLNRFLSLHIIAVPLMLLALLFMHIVALHAVGSNNPDGIEIKKVRDPRTGVPLDGIPFHPYYTVKDLFGAAVFLTVFLAIVFFAPTLGGFFLEGNNFVPADPLKTPAHIEPLWYFTPYYSILRAVTEQFMWVIAAGIIGMAFLVARSAGGVRVRAGVAAVAVMLVAGCFTMDPKFWGVVLFGASVAIFLFLPWLDRSPVRSIRYRGWMYKSALASFVVAFLLLGYLGMQPVTTLNMVLAQIATAAYFGFFLLMPWYSTMDKCKPEPTRVTE